LHIYRANDGFINHTFKLSFLIASVVTFAVTTISTQIL